MRSSETRDQPQAGFPPEEESREGAPPPQVVCPPDRLPPPKKNFGQKAIEKLV